MEHWWNDIERKTKVLGGKPTPVLLSPLQIPNELIWDWTRTSILGGRRL